MGWPWEPMHPTAAPGPAAMCSGRCQRLARRGKQSRRGEAGGRKERRVEQFLSLLTTEWP